MKRRGTNAGGTEREKEKEQLGGAEKEKEHEKMSSSSEPAATGMSRDSSFYFQNDESSFYF